MSRLFKKTAAVIVTSAAVSIFCLCACRDGGEDRLIGVDEEDEFSVTMDDIRSGHLQADVDSRITIDADITSYDLYGNGVKTYFIQSTGISWGKDFFDTDFLRVYGDDWRTAAETFYSGCVPFYGILDILDIEQDSYCSSMETEMEAISDTVDLDRVGQTGTILTYGKRLYFTYHDKHKVAYHGVHLGQYGQQDLPGLTWNEASDTAEKVKNILFGDSGMGIREAYTYSEEVFQDSYGYMRDNELLRLPVDAAESEIDKIQNKYEDNIKNIENETIYQYFEYCQLLDGIQIGVNEETAAGLESNVKIKMQGSKVQDWQCNEREDLDQYQYTSVGDASLEISLAEGGGCCIEADYFREPGDVCEEHIDVLDAAAILNQAVEKYRAMRTRGNCRITAVKLVYDCGVTEADGENYLIYYPYWMVEAYYATESEPMCRHTMLYDAVTGKLIG